MCIENWHNPKFVNKEDVLSIHKKQINLYGGLFGIRDEGLLDSAIYQPQASFGGELLHQTIYEQAAAYLFHICKNHAFIDGNKRTAFDVMVTFLNLNDYELNLIPEEAINPQDKEVEIYRIGKPVEIVQLPAVISGEDVLPGFELEI